MRIHERIESARPALLFALPAAVVALLYVHTIGHEFVHDDAKTLRNLEYWRWDWRISFMRPRWVTYAFHDFDRSLWGDWAGGFRLTNLVLYALGGYVAAWAGMALSRSKSVGLITGLAFALHPAHVEVVASFSNRKDLLAFLFVGLALITWVHWKGHLGTVVTFLCFALAYYSKEIAAIGLIPMLFLADVLLPGTDAPAASVRARRSLLRLSPLLVAGLLVSLSSLGNLPRYFEAEFIRARTESQVSSYASFLATSSSAMLGVFRLLLFPFHLSYDYAVPALVEPTDPRALAGLGAVILWVIGAVLAVRRYPLLGFGMLWVLVTYLPCSGIIPLNHIFLADRYLFVPSFGIALALGVAGGHLTRQDSHLGHAGVAALVGLLVVGAQRSWTRSLDWRDDAALVASALGSDDATWRVAYRSGSQALKEGRLEEAVRDLKRAAELQPRAFKVFNELGIAVLQAGQIDQAIIAFRHAAKIEPSFAWAHHNLGVALRRKGDPRAAIAALEEAERLDPSRQDTYFHLGAARLSLRAFEAAIDALRTACALDPGDAKSFAYLGIGLTELGDYAGAEEALKEAIELDPSDPSPRRNLARVLAVRGDAPGARRAFAGALRIAPDDVRTLTVFAQFLIACSDPGVRDVEEAARMARLAVEQDPQRGELWETLGLALHEAGDAGSSAEALEKALDRGVSSPAATGFLLAVNYHRVGNHERALDWFRRSREAAAAVQAGRDGRIAVLHDLAVRELGLSEASWKRD